MKLYIGSILRKYCPAMKYTDWLTPLLSYGHAININKVPRDQSLSDLLYSATKALKKGGHLWTFTGNSALLPSYIIDFKMLSALSLLV